MCTMEEALKINGEDYLPPEMDFDEVGDVTDNVEIGMAGNIKSTSIWTELEYYLNVQLPTYLTNLLTLTGFDNTLSLKLMTPEDIENVEKMARSVITDLVDKDQLEEYVGIYKKHPEKFTILPGHRKLLEAIINFLNQSPETCNQESLSDDDIEIVDHGPSLSPSPSYSSSPPLSHSTQQPSALEKVLLSAPKRENNVKLEMVQVVNSSSFNNNVNSRPPQQKLIKPLPSPPKLTLVSIKPDLKLDSADMKLATYTTRSFKKTPVLRTCEELKVDFMKDPIVSTLKRWLSSVSEYLSVPFTDTDVKIKLEIPEIIVNGGKCFGNPVATIVCMFCRSSVRIHCIRSDNQKGVYRNISSLGKNKRWVLSNFQRHVRSAHFKLEFRKLNLNSSRCSTSNGNGSNNMLH